MSERRKIHELAVLYELEPTLKDVFVEGPTDRAFVRAVLGHAGLAHVHVYEVDDVDVPGELVASLGLAIGNRGRVIALAIELERQSSVDLFNKVCCIADADEEAGQPHQVNAALLLYTDYTSMQLYCLNAPTLQRYFEQVVLGLPLSTEVILGILQRVLRQTAVSRRVSSRLGLDTAPVDLTDDCTIAGSDVAFDTERFAQRLLNKAAASNRLPEYLTEFERIGATLPNSPLLWVHEEDLIDFLHWLVVRLRGASRTVPKHLLGKTLLLTVPLADAAAQPMFVELIRRLTRPSRAA